MNTTKGPPRSRQTPRQTAPAAPRKPKAASRKAEVTYVPGPRLLALLSPEQRSALLERAEQRHRPLTAARRNLLADLTGTPRRRPKARR